MIGGHHGVVNASKFCPVHDALLVTIGEDRTFKVNNLKSHIDDELECSFRMLRDYRFLFCIQLFYVY